MALNEKTQFRLQPERDDSQASRSIVFLTHHKGKVTDSSIICKHIRQVQRQQPLSKDTLGNVMAFLAVFSSF